MMVYDNSDSQFSEDKTYWEKVSNTRWGAYTTDIARSTILRGHNLLGGPATALEIGCEGGRWSRLLTDLGWNMVCTDVNEKVLKICQKRIPTANCILVNPDSTKIPCESNSLSLILCIEVAPVIQSDWFINEAFRTLKNNGLIVGVFWNLLSFRGLFVHLKDSISSRSEWYNITYRFWKKDLLNKDFSILYEEGYCWFPFPRDSNSVFVPFFTQLEKRMRLHKLSTFSPWIAFIAQKK